MNQIAVGGNFDAHILPAKNAYAREDDEVVYYVNRDFVGWVEQHVRRHVYIELKLECTRNRTQNVHKARDDWLCLYCRGSFPSKLRLTDHRVWGCPCGLVNSIGLKWEFLVYPNSKTTKLGKDPKLALQRGDFFVWDNLHDNEVWLDLNPELKDVTSLLPEARVQERWFMEATMETSVAYPASTRGLRPQPKSKRHSLPGKILPRPRHQLLWTFQMRKVMSLKRPLPDWTNIAMQNWRMATTSSIRADNSKLSIGNKALCIRDKVLVKISVHQNLHDLRILRELATEDLFPTPFTSHLSKFVALHQRRLSFWRLLLLLRMCHPMRLCHFLPLGFRMWFANVWFGVRKI